MRHMHDAEAHICSAVQPKHAPPCGIAIHMKGSARQRKTNMEKDNMNDELLGGLPESDADGAEYEEVYIEEEFENGEGRRDAGNISGERQGVAELWMEYRKK